MPSTTPLALSPSVQLALVVDRRTGAYLSEVDCRLLFLGGHYRHLVRTYRDLVSRFGAAGEPERLFATMSSSAEITRFYEIRRVRETVSATLRDSVFRAPGPMDDVEVDIKISRGRSTFFHPLPLARLRALGGLLPLLARAELEAAIPDTLCRRLERDDRGWALEFLAALDAHGCLERVAPGPNVFCAPGTRPRVTLLGHSSLLLQSRDSAVVVDPILRPELGHPRRALDVARLALGGICCSHAHWDHCDLQSLLWFDKTIPIFVPRVRRPSAFNPPMVGVLERLGFTTIREVEPWKPVAIDDIELVPVPFHGEQDEPEAEIDRYTYVLRTPGLTLYGGVDSFRDTFGDMTPVLERVARAYGPSVAFLPVSRMIYQYRHGGVNGFCRYLDRRLVDRSFQYTAGPQEAAAGGAMLGARWIVPYATFCFSRQLPWAMVSRFHTALRARGLGGRLYPLRPLDALPAVARRARLGPGLRRLALIAWCHTSALRDRLDRGPQGQPGYRTLGAMARTWRRFRRRPAHERRLVVETMLALALARIAVVVLPLRRLGWLVSRPVRRPEPPAPTREELLQRVRWAVTACADHAPWRARCFEQGLAAQLLLRRRGIPAVLHVGAGRDDQATLSAHVWVRAGDVDVVGGETSQQFGLLISLPPPR